MTEYPSQLARIEAHVRRRLRSRIISQQKKRRTLVKRLVERGVDRQRAAKTVYTNNGRWALSHKTAIERAYPNKWFIQTLGIKVASDKKLEHWRPIQHWIKLA